jgi:hypothetical protein
MHITHLEKVPAAVGLAQMLCCIKMSEIHGDFWSSAYVATTSHWE